MKNMKKLIISIFAALTFVACDDPNEGSLFVQPTTVESEMTMTTLMEKSPETYSLWIELLKHANFYNAMKDANANATAFCPNNNAMQKFLRSRGVSSVQELDVQYARQVVKAHIIDWQADSRVITDSSLVIYARNHQDLPAKNLFEQDLTLSFGYQKTDVDDEFRSDEYLSTDSIFINNQAKLARFTGSSCANGDIYVMDEVILPNVENIVQKLEVLSGTDNTFKLFAEAIKADEEIYKMASLVSDTITGEGGVQVVRKFTYTCFAVPDHVFAQEGINTVDDLKTWLVNHSNGEETDGTTALNHYLKYHFLSTERKISEVFNFINPEDPSEKQIYSTQFDGQAFTANMLNKKRLINEQFPVLRSDIKASNGMIHKIGGIMPVYHPAPVTVRWDFLNSSDIIAWVNNYSNKKNMGNIFTSPMTSTAQQIDLSDEYMEGENGVITSFTYKYNESKASSKNYRRIGFMKEKYKTIPKKDENTPEHGTYMNNYLVLNLGFAGWIDFTTPTIIAGKYKVVLHYVKDPALSTLYTSGTLTQFNLDDTANQKMAYLYRGEKGNTIDLMYQSIEETLWNEVVFDKSEPHQFKITIRDMNAKNASTYHLRLDYVEFIPLNQD